MGSCKDSFKGLRDFVFGSAEVRGLGFRGLWMWDFRV